MTHPTHKMTGMRCTRCKCWSHTNETRMECRVEEIEMAKIERFAVDWLAINGSFSA